MPNTGIVSNCAYKQCVFEIAILLVCHYYGKHCLISDVEKELILMKTFEVQINMLAN